MGTASTQNWQVAIVHIKIATWKLLAVRAVFTTIQRMPHALIKNSKTVHYIKGDAQYEVKLSSAVAARKITGKCP